jgi:hypothetical protein
MYAHLVNAIKETDRLVLCDRTRRKKLIKPEEISSLWHEPNHAISADLLTPLY